MSALHDTTGREDVHGDVNELDEVADEAHDCETDSDSLGDLNEFCGYAQRQESTRSTVLDLREPLWDGLVHRVRNYDNDASDCVF